MTVEEQLQAHDHMLGSIIRTLDRVSDSLDQLTINVNTLTVSMNTLASTVVAHDRQIEALIRQWQARN